jgi:hypothetical protein
LSKTPDIDNHLPKSQPKAIYCLSRRNGSLPLFSSHAAMRPIVSRPPKNADPAEATHWQLKAAKHISITKSPRVFSSFELCVMAGCFHLLFHMTESQTELRPQTTSEQQTRSSCFHKPSSQG